MIDTRLLLGEFPPMQQTGIRCDCGFSDMQPLGVTPRGYPKYHCPICHSKTDLDPKNEALRNKIDRKLRRATSGQKLR